MNTRDNSLDILRFIGLVAIFMAHTFSSVAILQAVCFDVTLLMLLSGASFAITMERRNEFHWGDYMWKRIVRLVFPTWIFLAIYFGVCYAMHANVSPYHPLYSFTLLTEWYVWIIRVFLFIAALSPIILWQDRLIKNNTVFVFISILFFAVFDICTNSCLIDFPSFEFINQHIWQYLLYMLIICIPYTMIYAIGFRIGRFSNKELCLYSIVFLTIFALMCFYKYQETGEFVRSDVDKYPPHMYYVSFTVGVSMILWRIRKPIEALVNKIPLMMSCVLFIGQNTIWIYLWHVLILTMTKGIHNEPLRFVMVFVAAIIIYLVQYSLVKKIVLPNIKNESTRKYISRIFCG